MATWAEMPRSPGRRVLRSVAGAAQRGGLRRVPWRRRASRATRRGWARPSPPPGGRVRRRMIRCFGGLDERAWRRADSYSLREFLRLSNVEKVPDHSWLSRARSRLPARGARAVLRPCPQSRRHAGLAARTGEYPQALPDPCRRLQSRRLDARAARVRGRRERQARAAFIFIRQTADPLVLGPSSTPNPPRSSSPSASRQAQTEIGTCSTGCEST